MKSYGAARGGLDQVLVMTRIPADVFSGATKRAVRSLRDAAITDTSDFDDDPRLAIILRWGRGREVLQVRREGAWRDLCVITDRL